MRASTPLNDSWRFSLDFREAYADPSYDDAAAGSAFVDVRLPHAAFPVPYDHFDERDRQGVCCYRHALPPREPDGRRTVVRFEAAMAEAEVFVDGARAGAHRGGYTPFSFDLTDFLRKEGGSVLCVRLDNRELPGIPPFGGAVDYLTYGGLYREVSLETLPPLHVAELTARTRAVLSSAPVAELEAELNAPADASVRVEFSVAPCEGGEAIVVGAAADADGRRFRASVPVPGARLWDLDSPVLYRAEAVLRSADGPVDRRAVRFGFREAVFEPDGFRLNGRRLKLRGLNRHQSFPYVGYAMPAGVQRRDAELLKRELGCSLVRSSHYPASPHFLDRCDEIGLLVFEELPGWQHIGDEEWKETALSNLAEMVRRDRNRPSVVLWGVRINESADDDAFYARTNALARSLDPTRQTGGVRNLRGSSLLEDVYTYNDFSHDGARPGLRPRRRVVGKKAPYLVTEHNGHMFPTKRFDPEDRLVEHALRHLRVLDAAYGAPDIAGAVGWCFADYNTHEEFGSGNRICHHGVLDAFRGPKYAAAAYSSQRDDPPFGFVASELHPGDRDGMNFRGAWVFTNSERVAVYRNDRPAGEFFPDRRSFPNLPHPPVLVDDLIGDRLEDLLSPRSAALVKKAFRAQLAGRRLPLPLLARMKAAIAREALSPADLTRLYHRIALDWYEGSVVYRFEGRTGDRLDWTVRKGSSSAARELRLSADSAALREEGSWEAVRLEASLTDGEGNPLRYAFDPVSLRVDGPLETIGPDPRPLSGGSAAFWLRTTGRSGKAAVTAECGGFRSEPVVIEVGPG